MPTDKPLPQSPRYGWLSLAAVFVALLFLLGAQPGAGELFPSPWDKLAHFVAFGAIALLLSLGMGERYPWLPPLITSLVGAADEWHQLYLPGRSADLADWATDIAAALCVAAYIRYRRCRRAPEGPLYCIHHT